MPEGETLGVDQVGFCGEVVMMLFVLSTFQDRFNFAERNQTTFIQIASNQSDFMKPIKS